MNRFRKATAVLALVATMGSSATLADAPKIENKISYEEGQWAHNMVTREDIMITEEFIITEIFDDGDIRGEKTIGGGEGVYLEQAKLEAYGLKLNYNDVIRVSWVANDYWDEQWDKTEQIIIVKKGK